MGGFFFVAVFSLVGFVGAAIAASEAISMPKFALRSPSSITAA